MASGKEKGLRERVQVWSNRDMEMPPSLSEIQESERTPLVKWLLQLIGEQQVVIEQQQASLDQLEAQVRQFQEELKAAKGLPKKPKIQASRLNHPENPEGEGGKRAGSTKRSKKISFEVDEQRVIEPLVVPEGARFNGYREYDVQDLIVRRHNIRLLLAEYVTPEGKTVTGQVPREYQGHYGATLVSFVLYQHHQCRVPQPLILEELREFGIDISAGQVNRILIEDKETFHAEQQAVLSAGLETAKYVHTDDTGARHQGQNGYCTVIGNDLEAHFSSTGSFHSGEFSADFTWAASRLRTQRVRSQLNTCAATAKSATWPNFSSTRLAASKLRPTGRYICRAWASRPSWE